MDDSCEDPLTREEFVAMLHLELIAFEGLPPTSETRTFEQWFEDFEADVFAPAGP